VTSGAKHPRHAGGHAVVDHESASVLASSPLTWHRPLPVGRLL
jgi:hypothetical protein